MQHPVKFLVSRLLMKSGLSKRIIIPRRNYSLRFYPSPYIAQIWINPDYSREEEQFFIRYLKQGDTVIDVGANIGLISFLSAHLVGERGKVFSIEANPRVYSYFKGNSELNRFSHVTCFNYAVSNGDGEVLFTDNNWDEINAVVSSEKSSPTVTVPTKKLDDIVDISEPINLLKIDVEGYEKFVLEGAERILNLTQCVYFESNKEHFKKYGYQCSEVFTILRRHRFQLFKLNSQDTLAPIGMDYISEINENLVAVKDIDAFTRRTGF